MAGTQITRPHASASGRGSTLVFGASPRRQVMGQSRLRLSAVAAVFAVSFGIIGWRVVELSLPGKALGSRVAERHVNDVPEGMNLMTLIKGSRRELAAILDKNSVDAGRDSVMLPRVDIADRNGLVLATSLETASLYADAREIRDPPRVAATLAATLKGGDVKQLAARLASGKSFVWLRRNLAPREQRRVNDLGIPGLYFQKEYVRVYPQGRLMSHVLGFVGVDNTGLAGVERFFEKRLLDTSHPSPLQLSLDARVQHLMHAELAKAMQDFQAIGAVGVIVGVKTGEILSMVSLPDFDPNHPGNTAPESLFNRASLGTYEMGSSFKTFTVAQALETGTISLQDNFDATNPIRVANFTITDYHPKKRWLSVPEIFAYSSNIGTVKIAMEGGIRRQQEFLGRLGLLTPVAVELPERGMPQYPSPWREISMMTVSYGHGISVTPLNLVQGYIGILNEGIPRRMTLQKSAARAEKDEAGDRVVSVETSHKMRRLLRSVVQYGTGKSAEAPGYRVGGKTGTADKVSGHGYNRNARIASFMGAFPMDDPEYVVMVLLDEPKGNTSTYGYATGGWVAAPVASRVVSRMGALLGIQPVLEVAPDAVDAMWNDLQERERRRSIHAASY